MKSYRELAPKYLKAHKKKIKLVSLSVIIAVTLIVSIFSMLESLVNFERIQILKKEGNYHITFFNPSKSETDYVNNRIEVRNSGTLKDLGEGTINNEDCAFASLDEKFADNLNLNLAEGSYPEKENEIMLEKWFMNKCNINIGDTVSLKISDYDFKEFVVSGKYNDWGGTKAASIPLVFLSENLSESLIPVTSQIYILFKDKVNIKDAEEAFKKDLNLSEERTARNEGLLALMMQTSNNRVTQFYAFGGVLFCLILITAVTMIYNTFNISVMERVRQFGILRCIGASRKQVKSLVRREGFFISLKAIPIGIIMGMIITFICCAVLKYYNSQLFGEISLFNFSILGISLGVIIGFLTVFIASLIPAKKASSVSPVNAVTGSGEIKISKKKKKGFLAKVFPIDISLGIDNALIRKKTLILMSASIALSISLFMVFSVFVNPKSLGMKPVTSSTPDIYITSDNRVSEEVCLNLSSMDEIKKVNPTDEYSTVEIQLKDKNKDISNIQSIVNSDSSLKLHDIRQLNSEAQNAFMTMAVFIYGFVGVVVIISILNIINTINTSVESKTRYLGVMRAIGMSGQQVFRMVLTQSLVYSVSGCILGCTIGVILQKSLSNLIIGKWSFSPLQVILIFLTYIVITILSIINPLKRVKDNSISEVLTIM